MDRNEFDFVMKQNNYLKGGTKEACIKARDFLTNFNAGMSFVDVDEYKEAVKTLIAFAFRQEDTVPERWQCDNNCHRVSDLMCPGEFNIDNNLEKMCPFFMDEGFI